MNVVRLVKKGKISPDKVGDKVKKTASSMSDKSVEDFSFTQGELPKEAPKKKKGNLNLELWAEENVQNNLWSIIDEDTMVPEWLEKVPVKVRYDILSGFSLSEICGKNIDPIIEEAYKKIQVIKALSEFPIGKAKRMPGESGATSGHGTFITGEKDYIKEQGKEPGQSIFSMKDFIKKVPYEKNKELEDDLNDNETETPFEKEKKENPRHPRSIDILRRTSRSAQDVVRESIQNKLKKYGIMK